MREPNKAARLLLAIVVCSAIFADYWEYSRQYHGNPAIWTDVIQGTADAPQQYRIGIPKAAEFLTRHAHLGLRHAFTLIDFLSAALAAFLLYSLFDRSTAYRRAPNSVRWFGAAAFLFLFHLYLGWITWYQRPETLASAFVLVATLWLATAPMEASAASTRIARAAAILALAGIQGFIRADVAFAAHIGLCVSCLAGKGTGLGLGRKLQAATSAIGALLAAAIQFYLMHYVYPHATYGKTAVLELRQNLTNPIGILAFALFMLPWAWLASRITRRWQTVEASHLGLFFGSVIYLIMWFAVGRVEEVRIFLPYAIALIPLTVMCAMHHFPTAPQPEEDRARMVDSHIS